jgi:hypothetical protein
MPDKVADFHVYKAGLSGRPTVEVLAQPGASLDKVSAALLKNVTRNAGLLKAIGLKACPACISGFDILFRQRYDRVINVDLKEF